MSETDLQFLTDFEKSLPHHELICLEGGVYQMGGADEDAYDDEKPLHQVQVISFFMAKYPVTQALYEKVMDGDNPSNFKGKNRPVEKVSWDDAKIFLEKLNSLTGNFYRLPTEAEWEFAARGGDIQRGVFVCGE